MAVGAGTETRGAKDGPHTNSVRSLQALYSVVAGLALTEAVGRVVRVSAGGVPLATDALPLFLAFLVTLIPFFHGAIGHLDRAYVERGHRDVPAGLFMADYFLLFTEACIFLALARLLGNVRPFAWALLTLLLVDACWAWAVWRVSADRPAAERQWAAINTVSVLVLIVLLVVPLATFADGSRAMAWLLGLGAIARSVIDYFLGWAHYYPGTQ